jgi:hypothetical protein
MSEWSMSFDDELEKLGYRVGWLHSDVYNVYDPRGNVIGVEKNIRDARTRAHREYQKTKTTDVLHIAFFQEKGLWYAYLKTDEYTTYHVYSATGDTRREALQNLVTKMGDDV